jgi:hypothetical protein
VAQGVEGVGGGSTFGMQGSPDLQVLTTKQISAVCVIGVYKIAPNFVTLVATCMYMLLSSLKTSQCDIYMSFDG